MELNGPAFGYIINQFIWSPQNRLAISSRVPILTLITNLFYDRFYKWFWSQCFPFSFTVLEHLFLQTAHSYQKQYSSFCFLSYMEAKFWNMIHLRKPSLLGSSLRNVMYCFSKIGDVVRWNSRHWDATVFCQVNGIVFS